jgi:hypothetical protein
MAIGHPSEIGARWMATSQLQRNPICHFRLDQHSVYKSNFTNTSHMGRSNLVLVQINQGAMALEDLKVEEAATLFK